MVVKSRTPVTPSKGLGFDFPFLQSSILHSSPAPEEMSTNSAVLRKRRSELEFAEPELVGRERF